MKWGMVLLLAALAGGCDDDSTPDGGGGNDLSVTVDGGAIDLAGADLTCTFGFFPGFGGTSTAERRYDCPCGCTIDPFTSTSSVSGIWNGTNQHATFVPGANGLTVVVDATQGVPAIGGIASTNPAGPFYLDGDFDMLVDYELIGDLPPSAHALMQVSNLSSPPNGVYTIERDTTAGGANEYTGTLAGIQPVSVATSKTSGTLQLKRTGFVLQAITDGNMVTQYTGAVLDRMAVLITAAVETCAAGADAGACTLTVRWKNLRLNSGSIVDRN